VRCRARVGVGAGPRYLRHKVFRLSRESGRSGQQDTEVVTRFVVSG
jgi:hypothetical protein